MASPRRLRSTFHDKVWGSTRLSPWFPDSNSLVGEVWFETNPPLPILIKFLFTSERLSVQVHPKDEYAAVHENSRGKTEMWYILRADPGAQIAMGLCESVPAERLREAAQSGEIEQMLRWVDVRPGEVYFIPAGTIHAIGGGLAICEIQQLSDVTYRLYDYGRPRELHLDKAMDVSVRGPWRAPEPSPGYLAHCEFFCVEETEFRAATRITPRPSEALIFLEGSGQMDGQPYQAGEAWQGQGSDFGIEPDATTRVLRAFVP